MGETKETRQADDDNDVIMADPEAVAAAGGAPSAKPGSAKSSRNASIPKEAETTEEMESAESLAEQAEDFKNQGNESYKKANYRESIQLYTKAIDLSPNNAAYYGNRSAAYLMINKYPEAVNDAKMSTSLDPNFAKGYLRQGKGQLCLGDYNTALRCFAKVKELDPNNSSIAQDVAQANAVKMYKEGADQAYTVKDYRKAIFMLDKALQSATHSSPFQIMRAECMVLQGRLVEAQEVVNEIVMREQTNADAIFVRGMCLYYLDQNEKAFQHFQRVLQYSPDHERARGFYKKAKLLQTKKETGNQAFKSAKWQEAYDLYTEALEIDPFNKKINAALYYNRATTASKLNKLDESINDCTKAVELDEGYIKAYLRRAKCYTDTEDFEKAVIDYETVCKLDKSKEHQALLKEAKLELKKSKRKDYYKLLGVSKTANEDEIKKAYRKSALLFHPDRFPNATDEEKKDAEKKFKDVGEAYAVLTDPKKKSRYDNGQDLDDMNSGMGGGDIDPNLLFQAFFGGGGGGMFGGGGGGGGSRGRQQNGGFQFTFG